MERGKEPWLTEGLRQGEERAEMQAGGIDSSTPRWADRVRLGEFEDLSFPFHHL